MAEMPQFRMPGDRAEAGPGDAGGRPRRRWVEAAAERRIGRSHLVVAIVALLLGVAGTLGAQAIAQQTGPRSEAAAREAAAEHLRAIAAGDDEAASLGLLSSAERAAAPPSSIDEEGRIRSPRVVAARLGDGTARVDVAYVVGDRTVLRPLDLVYADGAWRIERALGEQVSIAAALPVPVQVDAIAVVPATRTLLLLPGVHRAAPIETALVTMPGQVFEVDGDARSAVAIDLRPSLTEEALAQLRAAAIRRLEACEASRGCALPAGLDPGSIPDPVVTPRAGPAGEVAVEVPIVQGDVATSMLVVGRMSPDLSTFESLRCALALEDAVSCG